MNDQTTTAGGWSAATTLEQNLFLLRLGLGVFLLQWGFEKILHPEFSILINKSFYLGVIPNSTLLWQGLGVVQVIVILAFMAGFHQKWTYLIPMIIHGLSTVSSWGRLIDPYHVWEIIDPARSSFSFPYPNNHLFMTAVPVLLAFYLLYRLRDSDKLFALDHARS
jgi:putative oxidoreductase